MIIEQNEVELLSIKLKTPQNIDSEINAKSNGNKRLACSQYTNVTKFESELNKVHNQNHPKSNSNNDNENDNLDNDLNDDHYESTLRLLKIDKTANGACGFHLTRTKWDPYPWVSAIDTFTPAEKSGLKAGDCVLEVNGCDVLGLRITEIAKLVKSLPHQVTLLLWSSKCNGECHQESLCAAPMPRSMQRLSTVVQCVLSVLECPVCRDTITPPAMQCQNGHLLCVNCRIRAENCPVCRDYYYPRPALIAEQLQVAITSAFNLCRNEDKVRQKIFGRHNRQRQMVKTTLETAFRRQVHKSLATAKTLPDNELLEDGAKSISTITTTANSLSERCDGKHDAAAVATAETSNKRNKTERACNKLLTKLLNFKAYSMENLTNNNTNPMTMAASATSVPSALSQPTLGAKIPKNAQQQHSEKKQTTLTHHRQANTNQLTMDFIATNVVHSKQLPLSTTMTMTTGAVKPIVDKDLNINSNPYCCKQITNNRVKHFSLSSSDLTMKTATVAPATTANRMSATNVTCILESETASSTSSPSIVSNFQNHFSAISFKRRPSCIEFHENHQQSIARALKLPSSDAASKELPTTSQASCHHDNDDDDDSSSNEDMTSSIVFQNSTPSTISLNSSSSSFTSYLDLSHQRFSTTALTSRAPTALATS